MALKGKKQLFVEEYLTLDQKAWVRQNVSPND